MSTLPQELQDLIARFDEHIDSYLRPDYNETELRRDYLDHLIKILGWDVDNQNGYAENFREVIHEDRIKIEGQMKAPDYGIQMAGTRLFYLEAKKPSIDLKKDKEPAYQVRRYGWTAKMPVCLLSDFHEFAVYDTSIKPKANDDAAVARIFYCKYNELPEHNLKFPEVETNWDYIASLFSKDAVLHGSLDKLRSSNKKKGTQEVDEAFLQEIEDWRNNLARNITLRNDTITERQLNFVVQKTIDRIIFLRICEDRGIEQPDILKSIAAGKEVYKNLLNIFMKADDRYDSGLFHFHTEKDNSEIPDTLSEIITIDDNVLKEIINTLYYPAPYEFSVFPADILGSVYERFLGKVIRLTTGHHAKVEEKPEVRKAGGVFYTPNHITKYLIHQTLDVMLEGKTTKSASSIKVLDPGCGSGSFLIEAYQDLLDWYLNAYIAQKRYNPKLKVPIIKIPARKKGEVDTYKLTIQERKRILTTHIFGVDIDSQAVEVTNLSLMLKAIEGIQSGEIQGLLFSERVLPDMSHNIKCGNSIIGMDFYEQGTLGLTDDEQYKINAFDWAHEFPDSMDNGGFDVILGNPPYVFARDGGFKNYEKEYFYSHYKRQNYQLNTYSLFTERAYQLLKKNGRLGFIIPNNWLTINTFAEYRRFILTETGDVTIVNNLYQVFDEANVDTSLLMFCKCLPHQVSLWESPKKDDYELVADVVPEELINEPIIQFEKFRNGGNFWDIDQVNKCPELSRIATVKAGIQAYETGKGTPKQTDKMKKERIYHSLARKDETYRPYLEGVDVKRYRLDWSGGYLKYGKNLAAPRKPELFEGERILVRQIPSKLPYAINACIVSGDYVNDINSMIIYKINESINIKYLLAILNSRLISYWFNITFNKLQRKLFPQFKVNELERFPIAVPDKSKESIKRTEHLIALVDQMLVLKQKEAAESVPHGREILSRQIGALNRAIDKSVYELYGLSDDEIKIVEEK
jgi:type I restriction-modification system DNA methylase subunit